MHDVVRIAGSVLLITALVRPAAADGELRQHGRVLVRIDQGARPNCESRPDECDAQLVRRTSGYRFFSGGVTAGASIERTRAGDRAVGVGLAELTLARLILPSGDFDFGHAEGALVTVDPQARVRIGAMQSRTALFCTDVVDGSTHLPLLGMLDHFCRRDAVLGADAAIAQIQWDASIERLAATWAELGPSIEVLGNGHGHDRLLRSFALALTFDARTLLFEDEPGAVGADQSSLGATFAMRFRWRSPRWEIAAQASHRAPLVGGRGILEDYQSNGEATLRRNVSVGPRIVLVPGIKLAASYAPHPEVAFGSLVPVTSRTGVFIGLEIGVLHDAFGI
jgi:hypothetical protein